MSLSNDLISQFVKVTKDKNEAKKESFVYGTVRHKDDSLYVQLDGATAGTLTPIATTADAKDGERVVVMIKNHTATIIGNISSPSARTGDVSDIYNTAEQASKDASEAKEKAEETDNKVILFEAAIGERITAETARIDILETETAKIDELETDNIDIKNRLEASEGAIEELETDNVTIKEQLNASAAKIEELEANGITTEQLDARYATIDKLNATNTEVDNISGRQSDFENATAENFEAVNADILQLDTEKISTTEADAKYANIDFSNIGKAAIEYFYATSGLIKDVTVEDGTITGHLVGVTISGDLIEGNTIIAEKLVIKGDDGLYYKLNTDGVTTETEQTDYNSLNGSIIKAKSITATKISVDDLVAFDATIGGFNITDKSIYSGTKESVDNTTNGIYLDKEGQMAVGDGNNFLKYYKDAEGNYKLEISASSVKISSTNKNIEDTINDINNELVTLKDELTTNLRIDSSRGTVFKNNEVATVLTAVIYRGSKRITDTTTLKEEMGSGAHLEWQWQRIGETTFKTILSTDSRIGNGGFTFTLSPEDVDTKVVFMCQLITD